MKPLLEVLLYLAYLRVATVRFVLFTLTVVVDLFIFLEGYTVQLRWRPFFVIRPKNLLSEMVPKWSESESPPLPPEFVLLSQQKLQSCFRQWGQHERETVKKLQLQSGERQPQGTWPRRPGVFWEFADILRTWRHPRLPWHQRARVQWVLPRCRWMRPHVLREGLLLGDFHRAGALRVHLPLVLSRQVWRVFYKESALHVQLSKAMERHFARLPLTNPLDQGSHSHTFLVTYFPRHHLHDMSSNIRVTTSLRVPPFSPCFCVFRQHSMRSRITAIDSLNRS